MVAPPSDIQLSRTKKATAVCNLRDLRWVLHFSGSMVRRFGGSMARWFAGSLAAAPRCTCTHNLPIHVSTASASASAAFEIKLTAAITADFLEKSHRFLSGHLYISSFWCAKLKSILSASLTEARSPRLLIDVKLKVAKATSRRHLIFKDRQCRHRRPGLFPKPSPGLPSRSPKTSRFRSRIKEHLMPTLFRYFLLNLLWLDHVLLSPRVVILKIGDFLRHCYTQQE